MNTFDDRKKAFESKYATDAEMQFKVMAKRNKFVGLWAANLLGKSGDDAENYAREVIKSDMEEAGDEDVIRKVKNDLGLRGQDASFCGKTQGKHFTTTFVIKGDGGQNCDRLSGFIHLSVERAHTIR